MAFSPALNKKRNITSNLQKNTVPTMITKSNGKRGVLPARNKNRFTLNSFDLFSQLSIFSLLSLPFVGKSLNTKWLNASTKTLHCKFLHTSKTLHSKYKCQVLCMLKIEMAKILSEHPGIENDWKLVGQQVVFNRLCAIPIKQRNRNLSGLQRIN